MRKVHAFMKRDWFTCHDCLNLTFKGFEPYCRRNERTIGILGDSGVENTPQRTKSATLYGCASADTGTPPSAG